MPFTSENMRKKFWTCHHAKNILASDYVRGRTEPYSLCMKRIWFYDPMPNSDFFFGGFEPRDGKFASVKNWAPRNVFIACASNFPWTDKYVYAVVTRGNKSQSWPSLGSFYFLSSLNNGRGKNYAKPWIDERMWTFSVEGFFCRKSCFVVRTYWQAVVIARCTLSRQTCS